MIPLCDLFVYLARSNFSICFSDNNLKFPVGKYCDIAQPYKLLASKYIIYFEGSFYYNFSCICYFLFDVD